MNREECADSQEYRRERIPSASAPRPLRELLLAAVLVAVTLLAYIPAFRGGFLWDDSLLVVDNPLIKAPGGLRRIWFTTQAPEYLPLTFTVHWAEWRLWGGRPACLHVLNVLLHAAGAVCLWRILKRLALPCAWLAGVLFAVHPVAVASAAWISELKNTLSLVFCAASLLAFLKFDEKAECRRLGDSEIGKLGKRKGEKSPEAAVYHPPTLPISQSLRAEASAKAGPNLPISQFPIYLLSVILFLLALLSKTSVVMMPAVLLLCVWWRRGRISRKDLLRSVPFFALSLALGLITVWFQKHNGIRGEIVRPEGIASRVAAAGWIAWFYLFKVLLPVGLCVIYPRWNVDGSSVIAFLPLLLLAGGMAFLWTRRKSWGRAPLFAFAYFLIMLLPVLGLLDMAFMRLSLAADHLQYAAMIGVLALAAGTLGRACPERSRRTATAGLRTRWTGALPATGCAAALAFLTWGRASLYRDGGAPLWRDTLSKNPNAWIAHNNLALVLSNREDPKASLVARAASYEEAILHLNAAIRLKKDNPEAYSNRGSVYSHMGRYDQAISDFDKAIALDKDCAAAYNNRGDVYVHTGRYDQAISDFDKAIALNNDYAAAYNNRGSFYLLQGRADLAINDFDEAITLDKDHAAAYYNRGNAYLVQGHTDLAINDFNEAILLDKDYAAAYYNRGSSYLLLGRYDQAVSDFDKAVALKPDYADAFYNRAVAYYYTRDYEKAFADVKRCRNLGGRPNPDFLKSLTEAAGRRE